MNWDGGAVCHWDRVFLRLFVNCRVGCMGTGILGTGNFGTGSLGTGQWVLVISVLTV